jgi:hypothetical protein
MRAISIYGRSVAACAFAAASVLVAVALLTAAALVPPPPPAIPFLVLACIGCPMAAACELPDAVAVVRRQRRHRRDARAHDVLRRQLASLPERDHPLGL